MKNKIVISFARMSPPLIGHGILIKKVMQVALETGADHMIMLSKTQDKKKNPLPVDRKVFWAKKMFPGANIVAADAKIRTIIELAILLSGRYDKLVVVAGSDRVAEFKTLLEKYNGSDYNFSSIEVVSAGERDPDADGAAGMLATKMRAAAASNDLALIRKGIPSNIKETEARLLMKEIRSGMGMVTEGVSYKIIAHKYNIV